MAFRYDAQFGLLFLGYQWSHMLEPLWVRRDYREGKRNMKRIVKPEVGGVPVQEAEGGEWLESWPNLTEFLTSTRFSDPPEPRKPGSLIINTRFKLWSGILKCPNDGVQLRMDAPTPHMLFTALETALSTPGTPWEPDPYAQGRQAGKKK